MNFIQQNLVWVAMALVSGGYILWSLFSPSHGRKISPQQAILLINREHALLLDVRETAEQANASVGMAHAVPLSQLPVRYKELEGKKNRSIIALCASGQRAVKACAILRRHGFDKLYVVDGGLRAWQEGGFPMKGKAT